MTLATCKPRPFASISFYLFCQPPLHLCTRETCAALVFRSIWGTRALWLVSPLAGDNRALIARVLTHDVLVFADLRAFGIDIPSATGLRLAFCVCTFGHLQHRHGTANRYNSDVFILSRSIGLTEAGRLLGHPQSLRLFTPRCAKPDLLSVSSLQSARGRPLSPARGRPASPNWL